MVYYHFNKHLYIGLGQSKLPGNRQRVTSSGNLQFPDRAQRTRPTRLTGIFGAFAYWTIPVADQQVQLKAAVSSGDGRGALPINAGHGVHRAFGVAAARRVHEQGDYSEGDLEFEPKPKLSFGACTVGMKPRPAREASSGRISMTIGA